jgi:GT2 family glycosyltransferase
MKRNPSVVIIVSNYNGASYFYKKHNILWRIFSSLKKTRYPSYKILMADDKSTDKSIEYVKKNFPYVSIVINDLNGGFSKNNNKAIKYSMQKYKPDYIVLLNNDIIITDELWLDKLIEVAEADSKIGIVGSKLVYPNGRIQHAGMVPVNYAFANRGRGEKDVGQYEKLEEMSGVTFALVLIKTEVFATIGFLDENFFMGYEDIDFCLRAQQYGFKIIYNGKTKAIHLEGFTSTNSKRKETRYLMFFTGMRNYVYFSYKYLNPWERFIGICINIILGSFLTIEGKDRKKSLFNLRIKDHPFIRFKASIRAVIEGKKLYYKSLSIYKNKQPIM